MLLEPYSSNCVSHITITSAKINGIKIVPAGKYQVFKKVYVFNVLMVFREIIFFLLMLGKTKGFWQVFKMSDTIQ